MGGEISTGTDGENQRRPKVVGGDDESKEGTGGLILFIFFKILKISHPTIIGTEFVPNVKKSGMEVKISSLLLE